MSIENSIFYVFVGLTGVASVLVLLTRNLLYAAFALLLAFVGVAAIYVFASADFMAVTQLMVYVGGILILILFGVMLSRRGAIDKQVETGTKNLMLGIFIGVLIAALLFKAIQQENFSENIIEAHVYVKKSSIEDIGVNLMTKYILPFELAAILLMVALLGAGTIAAKGGEDD